MAENNLNLLYSKLGWYGCHYLVPDDRLIHVSVLTSTDSDAGELHEQLARLAFYSRSLFGKAVLPQPSS